MKSLEGLNKMLCLDLRELFSSEIFTAQIIEKLEDSKAGKKISRIYAGSSFCPKYFLYTNIYEALFRYCLCNQISISISLPVCSESKLAAAKEKLFELVDKGKGIIDEIVVNDIGMLRFVSETFETNIVLGRLFFKDPRDGRLAGFVERSVAPALLSFPDFINSKKISGVELDMVADILDLSAIQDYSGTVMVNYPYCYTTMGNICKFASVHKLPDKKFRPASDCELECMHLAEIHSDRRRPANKMLIRAGKAVYFYQNIAKFKGRTIDRYLYFPLDEFLELIWKK